MDYIFIVNNILIAVLVFEMRGFEDKAPIRLHLSVLSKRANCILGLYKAILSSILITVKAHHITVRVGKLPCGTWYFEIPFYSSSQDNNNVVWNLEGSTIQVKRSHYPPQTHFVLSADGNAVALFGKLLRHLTSSHSIQNCFECKFYAIPDGVISQLESNYIYDKIDIGNDRLEGVTPEDLRFLLEHLRAKVLRLNVECLPISIYKYEKHGDKDSLIQKLIIGSYSWVNFAELPSIRVISIWREGLHQMNTILKSWIAGKNRQMEIGDFELGKYSERNREIIFTGVESDTTSLTTAERNAFLSSESHFPNIKALRDIVALDITREEDWLRATVIEATTGPSSQPTQKMFVMVWSDANLRTIGRIVD
ncbi:hypothetical protein B9Z55_003304 [Caenorhabditis nigoni]|uniref:F-box associated domain-containing protein n=2 Tax=Caenorhabditis nigoni TaxID=1611254 RepID=A0A2G5VQ04_9PELO|nr:hypothetical protein B9Z55_003304 [Caenorhabditis nigoni]